MHLGARLKRLRLAANLSPLALARRARVRPGAIEAMEKGLWPALGTAMRVAIAFDVTLDELAGMPPGRGRRRGLFS
jgi:transcriptional regulator with XRE-family HTH domain